MVYFSQIRSACSKTYKLENSPLSEAFHCGDEFALKRWQTSVKTVYRVSSLCEVYVILVIQCLHPSTGSYSIQQLQSKDPPQLYQGRILLSANVKGGEKSMPAYLVCCHTTGTGVRSALFYTDTDAWAGS